MPAQTLALAAFAMIAFAGNSLLVRLALTGTAIDAASFGILRLVSGALVLWVVAKLSTRASRDAALGATQIRTGSWISAGALFTYVVAFSYAYLGLSAGAGALILFGTVQATMIGYGWIRGSRFNTWQWAGFLLACLGVAGLLVPGASAPDPRSAALMAVAGIAWGIYSLRPGRADPVATSASNFLRTLPLCLALAVLTWEQARFDSTGAILALTSGVITSGLGYVVWYFVVRRISVLSASTIQLSVPALAALMGTAFLGEAMTYRLVLSDLAVLIGIAAVLRSGRRSPATPSHEAL